MKISKIIQPDLPRFTVDSRFRPTATLLAEIDQKRLPLFVPLKLQLISQCRSEIDQPSILWQGSSSGGQWKKEENVNGCLEAFLKLANGTDDEISNFASIWGVLNCHAETCQVVEIPPGSLVTFGMEENIPLEPEESEPEDEWMLGLESPKNKREWYRENWRVEVQDLLTKARLTGDLNASLEEAVATLILRESAFDLKQQWFFEATDVYRTYARQAQAYLNIASDLYGPDADGEDQGERKLSSPEDWQFAISPDEPEIITAGYGLDFIWSHDLQIQRSAFCDCVSLWLRKSTITPVLRWGSDNAPMMQIRPDILGEKSEFPSLDLAMDRNREIMENYFPHQRYKGDQYNLFTLLTLQLMSALTSPNGIVRCSQCATPFNPQGQKARADRRRYCSITCSKIGHLSVEKKSRLKRKQQGKQTSLGDVAENGAGSTVE